MGNKTTILGMAALILLCIGYSYFLHYEYKQHPNWNPEAASNEPAQTAAASQSVAPSNGMTTTEASTGPSSGTAIVAATTQAVGRPATIGSDQPDDPTFALGLHLAPQGAALASVTINSYKDTDAKDRYVFQQPVDLAGSAVSGGPGAGPLATRSVTVDGQSIDLSKVDWQLEPGSTAASAAYGLDVLSADHKPLLHVSKTYQVRQRGPQKNRDNTAAGYEVAVSYHLRNLSGRPLNGVRVEFDGPTMPPREMERSDDRQIVAGYDKNDGNIDVTRDYLAEFKPGAQDKDISTEKNYKFLWAGTSSNYFAAVVLPDKQGAIDSVKIHCPNPDAPAEDRVAVLDFQSAPMSVPPGSSVDLPLSVFFGPKERGLMEGDYYGVFPRFYSQLLSTAGSSCGFCTLPWLVDGLVDLLQVFHFILCDWGLAIIALVVLVRAILHPISKHSQVSMLKLQKMGPEMERLKKKYGDDKEALAKAQMEMHKEMGITPFLGCLPMFLQMPIWIALYSALQNDIVLRQAPFLWGLTWIHDLARPDRLISWDQHPFTVPFFGMKVTSLNVLPLVMAVVMFLQQKLQPQPPTLTAEQASQQKMMRYMSLAFSLFFYWMPSGLNLYILTSSTIAIFESKIIRKHIKEHEEREKAGKVIVDAKPTRQGKQKQKEEPMSQASKPGCLGSVWANLQKKAEEVRREAERKGKKKG
ncbi:MAG: YidC/Oxa1 family insertase periplasmic-domain containing protein [Tepidisphaeraceae bacterium]|jgi:YidC/Oxa1 family membrane protein insertase